MVFEYECDVKVWAAEHRLNGVPNHHHTVVGTVKIAVEIDLKKALAARASTLTTGAAASVEQMAQTNPALMHLPTKLREEVHLALQKAVELVAAGAGV